MVLDSDITSLLVIHSTTSSPPAMTPSTTIILTVVEIVDHIVFGGKTTPIWPLAKMVLDNDSTSQVLWQMAQEST